MDNILRKVLAIVDANDHYRDKVLVLLRDAPWQAWDVMNTVRWVRSKGPLHRAVFVNDVNAVQRLLLGAPAAAVNDAGGTSDPCTPLQFAARLGHTECVRLLLSAGGDSSLCCAASGGTSPLFDAARFGYVAIVALLLDAGADPDYCPVGKLTPLIEATCCGQTECVQRLLRASAAVEHPFGAAGGGALYFAAFHDRFDCVAVLLQHTVAQMEAYRAPSVETEVACVTDPPPLATWDEAVVAAAGAGNAGILRLLLQCASWPHRRRRRVQDALVAAAARYSLESVQILLDAGVDVNAKDAEKAALKAAASWNYKLEEEPEEAASVVRALLAAFADPNCRADGFGPFEEDRVGFGSSSDIVALLLQHGAKPARHRHAPVWNELRLRVTLDAVEHSLDVYGTLADLMISLRHFDMFILENICRYILEEPAAAAYGMSPAAGGYDDAAHWRVVSAAVRRQPRPLAAACRSGGELRELLCCLVFRPQQCDLLISAFAKRHVMRDVAHVQPQSPPDGSCAP
jgi:ankyrin repeat protein